MQLLNGGGRTTTIKMLSTLLEPTEGTAIVDGLDILKDSMNVQKKIKMIADGERIDRLLSLVDLQKNKDLPLV